MSLHSLPRRTILTGLTLIGLTLALALPAAPALAGKLDDLRAKGAVGERFDGLLELRDKGNADAKKLIKEVNAKRRKIYQKRAKEDGATVEQVGQVYAKQIMNKAPKGTWFLKANGKWVKR